MRVERGIGFDFEDSIPPTDDVKLEDAFKQVVQLIQDDRWKLPVFSTSDFSTTTNFDFETPALSILSSLPIQKLLRTEEGGSSSLRNSLCLPRRRASLRLQPHSAVLF